MLNRENSLSWWQILKSLTGQSFSENWKLDMTNVHIFKTWLLEVITKDLFSDTTRLTQLVAFPKQTHLTQFRPLTRVNRSQICLQRPFLDQNYINWEEQQGECFGGKLTKYGNMECSIPQWNRSCCSENTPFVKLVVEVLLTLGY